MQMTQAELEKRMYLDGRDRAALMFANAEDNSRAADAPYAQRVYREYVMPLAEVLKAEVGAPVAGTRRAHAALLLDLDLDAVAFLAVRHTINATLTAGGVNHRTLGYALGRTVHRELVLAQIAESAPDLYHTLARDFSRRMSRDERHRMTVYQMQAKEAGVNIQQWGLGSRDQVGLYLLGKLEDIGLVEIEPPMTLSLQGRVKTQYQGVVLSAAVMQSIDAIKEYISETTPVYGPCVEPPLHWTGTTGGGFHTEQLRRIHRYLVKTAPSARKLLRDREMPVVLEAVNALQDTRWAVNTEVLDVLIALAEAGREVAGVTLPTDEPKPERQPWFDTVDKAAMTPEQKEVLTAWKRSMVGWYERRKLRTSAYGRFYSATRQAQQFRSGGPLHFVYFLDSRGRAYPLGVGLSPQGNDLQKGLLRFHDGMPIHKESAERWFLIHGANKFGFDKAKLRDREQWARDRKALILAMADDPLGNQEWTKADNPLQFLAWCFEYRDWVRDPGFVSHIPVSMDGSCNGLQHFSAMLRDAVGGHATNLTNNEEMQDIYGQVATAAYRRLLAAPADEEGFRDWWIKHGIKRDVVKRSVMTTPYGVTKRSATGYIVSDYLIAAGGTLERKDMGKAAAYIMSHIWPAIGDVVIKAREAMDWLRSAAPKVLAAKAAINDPDPVISWVTPTGFLATQAYFDIEIHRIRTLLHGDVRIRVAAETDRPDVSRHASALAPNFVHSMDAAHMQLVAASAKRHGIDHLAMIHDDYGTHAANADTLFHIIRQEFVTMYQGNQPLVQFAERYPEAGTPPEEGDLDITEVLLSDFFFS